MKEKLTLQDIVDLLAKKSGLSKKDTDAFFREFLAVITDSIFSNEPVKIKDFGTFKLTKVNSRESVDVNTGEKIEIPAHYKLSFLPDKALKELVNKPFSQFETTLLEDAVSFDSIEVSEEPVDAPEDEDTSDDEVEVIRQPKINVLPQNSEAEIKRQKEGLASKIESITPTKDKTSEEEKTTDPIVKSEEVVSSPYIFSYSYTSSSKEDDSEAITLVVPSSKTTIASKVEDVEDSLPTQEEGVNHADVSLQSDDKEEVTTSVKDTLDADDSELDSDVPLNINKVQEKIDQLKEAIEALEKISWASEVPENALSTKPSVDEADIYNETANQTANDKIESHIIVEENASSIHEEIEAETKTVFPQENESIDESESEAEDISDEIARGRLDNDLLKSLVAVDGEESSDAQNSQVSDIVDNEDDDFANETDDDDLDFYDYDKESARKKKRKRVVLIIFLLAVIGVGVYHLSKLLEHKVEYETYRGYYPSLTEGDTLPNAQIVQNLIDDLTLPKDTDNNDVVITGAGSTIVESDKIDETVSNEIQPEITDNDIQSPDSAASATSKYDKIISENLRIRVVRKGAYLRGLPLDEDGVRPSEIRGTESSTQVVPTIPVSAKIGQGMTLRNMAGKYYGHGIYWVYIFDENKDKIKDFDNVPAGLVVKLPDPKKYGINSKDPKSLQDARRREQALFSNKR